MAPVVLRCDANVFEGFLNVRESSDYFVVSVPNYPSFENYVLKCDLQLKIILDEVVQDYSKQLENCRSINSFVDLLFRLVSLCLSKIKYVGLPVLSHIFYDAVHQELASIGSSAIVSMDFSSVLFKATDEENRSHEAVIRIPNGYPHESLVIESHNFPFQNLLGTAINRFSNVTLTGLHKKFLNLINVFQPFWKIMDILDANSWVLEPQIPQCSDNFRRIQISEYCSALLTFDPFNAHVRPTIEFRGKQADVDKYRNLLETKLLDNSWENEVDVHLNLISILELDCLPAKDLECENEAELIKPGDCGICFEERLDGRPANQRCDNSLCDSQYHQVCLLKYLSSNLKNVRMKNAVLGRCPTCRDSIGCPTLSWDIL